MEQFWNSANLLKILIKWKVQIALLTLIGMLIIGGATYLIKPKFKSFAIVYPVNLGEYSEESYSEQMIQILKSREITDKVIEKHNLSEHYEVDTVYKHYQSTMYYLMNENISISKTEFESVEISVLDTDPEVASNMVNSIIEFYNEKVRLMHNIKLKELMELNKQHYSTLANTNDILEKKINKLNNEYGLLDYETQVEKLTEGIYRSGGNKNLINKAEKQLANFEKYGTEFTLLHENYEKSLDLYIKYKLTFDEQQIEYNKKITYANVVTSPYVADNKFSPLRIPITLLGGMSVFALVILTIGFIENRKYLL